MAREVAGDVEIPGDEGGRLPLLAFLGLGGAIFLGEMGIMHLLPRLPVGPSAMAFVDSLLLVLVLFPVLYFFLHRPLARQIEERRRMLEEKLAILDRLSESEARYRTLFVDNHATMLLIDPGTGEIVDGNPAASVFYGYPREELRRMRISDVNILSPAEIVAEMQKAAVKERRHFDFRHRLSDGSVREVEVYSGPIRIGDRRLLYSIVHDVTEAREAAVALSESEERLRTANRTLEALFAAAPLSLVAVSLDRRVTRWNPAAERLFGWRREEIVGEPYPLIPEERRDEFERHRLETLQGSSLIGRETVRLRRDGSRVEVSLSTSPIYEGEKITGILAIFEEITARKRMEEELRLAKESAERANGTKSEFLANMSHEIRTPMNGILGMTEVVLEGELAADQRECLQLAHDSARSLLHLLNDILDFSRLEAGMLTLKQVEFDLKDVLDDALKTFAVLVRQKGVGLTCRVSPGVPPVLCGDPARLRQVLTNLLANAVKFTEEGEISLEVAPEGVCSAGRVRFSVRDTGIGIPPEEQQRIFDNFVQVDASLTRRYGGSGLGLTICRNMVRLMGGRIWVESRPGEGSTFLFTADFPVPGGPVSATGSSVPPLLLVDDNPVHLQILEETVDELGLPSVSAASGSEALGLLRQGARNGRPFSAVLADLIMPGMDGLQLAEAIHQDSSIPAPALLLLTAGGEVESALWRRAGFTACLQKPVDSSRLAEALREPEASRPAEAPDQASPLPLPSSGGGLRVLLVEDERINQKLARMVLESRGHAVTVADNGAEALERLAEAPFDIVLMDVQMPVMNGLEAATRIRGESAGRFDPAIPIVAMTAHAMPEDREACLGAGMSGYVTKPLDLGRFMAVVEGFPERSKAASAPAETPARAIAAGRVLDLLGGDREGCREVWSAFRGDVPRLLARVAESLERGGPTLARAAHTLKGAAAAAGAEGVHRRAADLEKAAREERPRDLDRFYRELRDETARAIEEIRTLTGVDRKE